MPPPARQAASALARLAAEHVPGADPEQWHGTLALSTAEPLFDDDEPVPVSPSKLELFEESPLDWFVQSVSGSSSSTAMGIGTIVHWAMETATDPSVDALAAAIESRWNELVFESPWLAEQQKRAARTLAGGVAEYLADFAGAGKDLVAAEGRFALSVGRATVNGSIDRVERATDGVGGDRRPENRERHHETRDHRRASAAGRVPARLRGRRARRVPRRRSGSTTAAERSCCTSRRACAARATARASSTPWTRSTSRASAPASARRRSVWPPRSSAAA